MSASKWIDSKLLIWIVTMIAIGAMAYQRLETLGESVGRVQQSIDDQGSSLAEHIASPDHTTRGIRVAELETDQAKVEQKIEQIDVRQQRMERNQARMCLAWEVECE